MPTSPLAWVVTCVGFGWFGMVWNGLGWVGLCSGRIWDCDFMGTPTERRNNAGDNFLRATRWARHMFGMELVRERAGRPLDIWPEIQGPSTDRVCAIKQFREGRWTCAHP